MLEKALNSLETLRLCETILYNNPFGALEGGTVEMTEDCSMYVPHKAAGLLWYEMPGAWCVRSAAWGDLRHVRAQHSGACTPARSSWTVDTTANLSFSVAVLYSRYMAPEKVQNSVFGFRPETSLP